MPRKHRRRRPTLKGEISSIRQTISRYTLFQHSQDHAFEAFISERVRSVEPATSLLSQPRCEAVSGSFPSLEKLRPSYLTTYIESTGGELAPGSVFQGVLTTSVDLKTNKYAKDHGKTPSTRVASQFSAGPLNRMSNGWRAMGVLRLLLETCSAAERPA
ncbi:hypothetical protein EI94DRAFT_1731026 [Lactarius quietus]|nr:hypothetical protein EI94DRAFT_1731026 [Lactarius quietus]